MSAKFQSLNPGERLELVWVGGKPKLRDWLLILEILTPFVWEERND